ncbi:phage/plasmid replication protein, II/X family [Thalassotalea ganghwensis]
MIDWSLVKFPIVHQPINSGEVFSTTPDGEVEWRSPKRTQATGSFEKKVSIKSVGGDGRGFATHLWVNGNPAKFLQGHNVFGSDDIVSLLSDLFDVIAKQHNLKPTAEELQRIRTGDYELTMVDINYSYELPSMSDVKAFIRALEFKAKTRHGRPSSKGGTLYFGKTSQRWALKFYCKAEEIQTTRGRLPNNLTSLGIETWATNKLRIELRLLSKQLKSLGIEKVKDLNVDRVNTVFNEYLRKIEMSEQIALTDEKMAEIPKRLRMTYRAWLDGHDLRDMLSKSAYYRHRADLKEYGINIDLRPESTQKSNVVPLIRVLEARPAAIPHFAFQQGLVHHSATA